MDEIKVNGLVTVGDMQFHEAEGGFGPGKKSMLVKDIAAIHGRELFKVNQLINNNRKRFTDGEDIIDLKTDTFKVYVSKLISQGVFTKAEVGNAKNLYILSERGYFKLLKLLEDDLAWDKFDELLDGYFHMRKVIKETPEALERIKAEAAKERASAMSLNAKTRAFKAIMSTFDGSKYSPIAAEVFGLTALETVTGQKIDYRPEFGQTWTATDVQKETGISNITIGKIATAAGLKCDTYGKAILNHAPGQSKQVPEFHYNSEGHKLLLKACEKWKADHVKKPSKSKSNGKAA